MEEKIYENENENVNVNENENVNVNENVNDNEAQEAQEETATADNTELEQLRARVAELEDKNLRQIAEFDNYRRRTNKEKLELMATAGERIFKDMLPLIDDFERAANHGDLSEGGQLIYKKFLSFLDSQNVHAIETENADFNTDEHEAITTFAAGEDKKGKIIDCTTRGYKLGEKVIRFAKVVVGE